jgi:CRISPR-associated protein Csb1
MTQQEIHHIALVPEPSGRFQPTGFADLGAALYDQPRPNAEPVKMLLVESVQSMANHLEATGWNALENRPVEELAGLPWVKVKAKSGEYLTSSRTEAHRLASAFIRNSTLGSHDFLNTLKKRFGLVQDRPVNLTQLAGALFRLDPLNLIHGVFFAVKKWPHQPKITRAITAFIEAEDVREVHSGGVKTDEVRHKTSGTSGGGSAEGYGMVPFHRVEYTAARTQMHVAIDVGLLGSYGLSKQATRLLDALARWELASLLSRQLRLRTACSFRLAEDPPSSLSNPSALAHDISQLARECPELKDSDRVTEVIWNG